MQTTDYPAEERNYYAVENRVRRAWVVVLEYEDNFDDVVKDIQKEHIVIL